MTGGRWGKDVFMEAAGLKTEAELSAFDNTFRAWLTGLGEEHFEPSDK